MNEEKIITIRLTKAQQAKVAEKFKAKCTDIRISSKNLPDIVKYIPSICIDFTATQEKIVHAAFPKKECDFAVINIEQLTNIMKYIPAPPTRKY
jgi:hypothetical protein